MTNKELLLDALMKESYTYPQNCLTLMKIIII